MSNHISGMTEGLKPDIVKAGAIIIDDQKRLLITKPKTKDMWVFVGGKLEAGETMEECLVREIQEELGVNIVGEPQLYMKSPIEPAAGNTQGLTVQITAYVARIDGEPMASSEIEAIHWLSREEFEERKFALGSVLQDHVIPRLIQENRM